MSEKNETYPGKGPIAGYTVITKTMIGSGLLGMAYTCSEAGIYLGIVLLLLSGLMTWFSLHLLGCVGVPFVTPGAPLSFMSVAKGLSPRTTWVVDAVIVVSCFGTCIAYLEVIGEMLSKVMLHHSDSVDPELLKRLVKAGVVCLTFPLVMAKSLTKTEIPNMIGLICLVYVCAIAFVFTDFSTDAIVKVGPSSFMGVIYRLPVFFFAYCCQSNLFPVIQETSENKRTTKVMSFISAAASVTGAVIMLPVMLLPYATFGSNVKANFLQNLDISNVAVQVAYLAVSLSVIISLPLQMQPMRRSAVALLTKGAELGQGMEAKWRIGSSVVASVVCMGVGLFVDDLGLVMVITGLIGCNTVSFVFPAYLFLCAFSERFGALLKGKAEMPSTLTVYCAWALFVLMILFYPVSLFAILYEKLA